MWGGIGAWRGVGRRELVWGWGHDGGEKVGAGRGRVMVLLVDRMDAENWGSGVRSSLWSKF